MSHYFKRGFSAKARPLAMVGVGLVVALLGFGSAYATHTVTTEEHVVPFTVGDVTGAVTITDEDQLLHETITVTETVIVTETSPPSPPSPPPSGGQIIRDGTNWTCTGPVDLDLVRITNPGGSNDALRLGQNCSGRIGRVELSGPMADGIKVLNAGTVAHDLVIESGFVWCGQPSPGVHQDGMQAMGGYRITMHVAFDCLGGGGGNWFPSRGGSGASTPTDIVCDGCAFGPQHPNNVQIQTSLRSGIRDSFVCRPLSGRNPIMIGSSASSPVNENSQIVPSDDPGCTRDRLLAYVGG